MKIQKGHNEDKLHDVIPISMHEEGFSCPI